MIFIGYNYDGYPISIISAKSEESANAYWQGKDCLPHSTRQFDVSEDRDNEKLGFVSPLLETHKASLSKFGQTPRDFLLVSKKG